MKMRRVAVVTGASRGIGRAIAEELARDGLAIAAVGRPRSTGQDDPLADVARAVEGAGGICRAFRCDLADVTRHQAVVNQIVAAFGHIDVLVSNAGVGPRVRRDLLEMTPESFDEVLSVNLRGCVFFAQRIAPHLLAAAAAPVANAASVPAAATAPTEAGATSPHTAGRGQTPAPCIVFITSVSAEMISTSRAEYCMSKAALSMAARTFAARLAGDGVNVYEVRPGIVRTDMTAPVAELYDRRIAEGLVPQGRWGEPEDVARAVRTLVSGDFDFATGTVVDVGGGLFLPRL